MDNNNPNKDLPQQIKEDNIVNMKPQTIKMDLLLFKNDVLREITQIEKGIIEKSKEATNILKDKITLFDNKVNFINEQITSISKKMVDGVKQEEKINTLIFAREQLLDETTTNRIKISMLEKETRDSINRIDEILKQSVIYPSIIGIKGKFRNFHEFIDFLLAESNTNNNFRQKNIMDLSSYKLKIEKALQALGFKIESILSSCNSFTLRNVKEVQDKFDYLLGQYKDKLNDLRIENSNYVIQLEKDTKDLRNETNIVKSMKADIYSKVDHDLNNMKKDNLNIVETFKSYKNDFEKMNQNIRKIENNMDSLLTQRIGLLFDEQKKLYENIDKLRKENNEFLNEKINDIIKNIVNEQIKNFFGDINIKQLFQINNFNNEDNNNINNNINGNINSYSINNLNINSNNQIFNNNNNALYDNNSKDKINNNYNNINKKSKLFSKRHSVSNISSKNVLKNNYSSNHFIHKIKASPRRHNVNNRTSSPYKVNNENESNYNINNYNHENTVNNFNYNKNIIMNKKIRENINNNNKNNINNKINDNILFEIKNDNILNARKNNFYIFRPHRKKSFHSYSQEEEINNNINNSNANHYEQKPNLNKYSIVSRNKNSHKLKNKVKSDDEFDNYDNYIKIFNITNSKFTKRRSFDKEKNKDLQKFQRLLKINLNDVDAKLNNVNSMSSSFELLNENQEIYDRFMDSKLITKDDFQTNKNDNNNNNEFNKYNVQSSDKNFNEEELNIKNIALAKTSSDFYPIESKSNKKTKYDYSLNPIKNKNIFKTTNKINENNSNLIKKTNYDLFNLRNDVNKKAQNGFYYNSKTTIPVSSGDQTHKQSEDSLHKYHNYFIGFQFGGGFEDNKKIKKNKNKNKTKHNKYYQMMVNEDKKSNNHKIIKK